MSSHNFVPKILESQQQFYTYLTETNLDPKTLCKILSSETQQCESFRSAQEKLTSLRSAEEAQTVVEECTEMVKRPEESKAWRCVLCFKKEDAQRQAQSRSRVSIAHIQPLFIHLAQEMAILSLFYWHLIVSLSTKVLYPLGK